MRFIEKEKLPELREAFVKNRFAEESYFANSEIESWLESQKESSTPRVIRESKCAWSHYLHLLHKSGIKTRLCRDNGNNVTIRDLLRFAGMRAEDVLESKEYAARSWLYDRRFAVHLAVAKSISDEVYITDDILILFPRSGSMFDSVVLCPGLGCGGTYQTEGALSVQIAESLLLSWEHLTEDDERKYRAREYLCETLSRIVAEVRAQAEEEFDCAVAVSEDGKKIIRADMVVVWGNKRLKIISASSFREKKIVREKLVLRPAWSIKNNPVEVIIKRVEEAVVSYDKEMKGFCKHFGITEEPTPVTQIFYPGKQKCFLVLEETE